MRDLKKLEIWLAFAMPIAAAGPIVWLIAGQLNSSILLFDSQLLPLYLFSVVSPVAAYTLLGLIGYLAARRESVPLTVTLGIFLIPTLVLSGFLLFINFVWTGFHAIKIYGPAPAVAILAAVISTVSRVVTRQGQNTDHADLI